MENFNLLRQAWISVVLVLVVLQVTVSGADRRVVDDSTNGTRVTDSLKLVIVVSRHGNRGGTKDYPFDPYPIGNTTYWPYGANGLTTHGRQQMYKLGSKIRSLYDGFLDETFKPEEVYAASTAEERTLMSGECFLAGLYPPSGFQVWNKRVYWQPTPFYSNSSDKTPNILSCPKFVQELETTVEKFLEEYALNITAMITYYNKITGANATGLAAAKYLYHLGDKLISEATEGYSIPKWTKKLYPKPLLPLVGKVYINYFAGTTETVRLVIGKFFEDILKVMISKVDGTLSESRKIHYYSGHDSSLVTLQVVLGIPSNKLIGMVRPGSALVLELHQNDTTSDYFVQPLYIDGASSYLIPKNLSILDCGTSCDFASFVSGTQNYTGVDYDRECEVDTEVSGKYLDLVQTFF